MSFHARAMEMYTYAHQQLMNIDIAHDLEVIDFWKKRVKFFLIFFS